MFYQQSPQLSYNGIWNLYYDYGGYSETVNMPSAASPTANEQTDRVTIGSGGVVTEKKDDDHYIPEHFCWRKSKDKRYDEGLVEYHRGRGVDVEALREVCKDPGCMLVRIKNYQG